MKRILSYAVMVIFLTAFSFNSTWAASYQVRAFNNDSGASGSDASQIKYKVNDFYSVYYIYMNVIRAMKVDERLSNNEVAQVINDIIHNLNRRKAVQLTVSGYSGDEDLRVTLRTKYDNNKKPILMVVSNYDAKKQKTVTGEEQRNAYGTFFYLMNDKLVKYQYISQAKTKKEQAKKSTNNLADYYLMDEKQDNDAEGKELLINGIKNAKKSMEKFIMNLTLSEYHLLENDTAKAATVLEVAKKIMMSADDAKNQKRMKNIFKYADDINAYFMSYRKSG